MKKSIKFAFTFLMCIALSFYMTSCSSSPDNKIVKTEVTQLGVEKIGDNYFKSGPVDTVVTISATLGQGFHYANKAGNTFWFILSFLLWAGAIAVVYYRGVDGKSVSVAAALLALGLASFGSWPGTVAWNNNTPIPKSQYDFYMQRDGNIKAVWDSLEVNGAIYGGPNRK